MKISDIHTFVVNIGGQNRVLLKVLTDEHLHGIGEAYCVGPDEATVQTILYFKDWLIGQDPQRIEYLWRLRAVRGAVAERNGVTSCRGWWANRSVPSGPPATRMDARRFRHPFRDDRPAGTHLAKCPEIPRLVGNLQMRCLEALAALMVRLYRGSKDAGRQECPLQRIRSLPFLEMRLDGVGERLEEIAVLPGPHVKARGLRLGVASQPTGEIPAGVFLADLQHDRSQTIPITDENAPGRRGVKWWPLDKFSQGRLPRPKFGSHGRIG